MERGWVWRHANSSSHAFLMRPLHACGDQVLLRYEKKVPGDLAHPPNMTILGFAECMSTEWK
jgi:hypothetical protein